MVHCYSYILTPPPPPFQLPSRESTRTQSQIHWRSFIDGRQTRPRLGSLTSVSGSVLFGPTDAPLKNGVGPLRGAGQRATIPQETDHVVNQNPSGLRVWVKGRVAFICLVSASPHTSLLREKIKDNFIISESIHFHLC